MLALATEITKRPTVHYWDNAKNKLMNSKRAVPDLSVLLGKVPEKDHGKWLLVNNAKQLVG
ncbi:hypothetical protein LOOC260_117840 [Paucilactobacillus hokkaidonensis JCM 18461]|uniref:Uncharacterized protein n=1 Tax=Paucilactobacillus hokkaidonensis JCM 18461 TaxID=1291742 RepID=A0A0A1H0R0_9LACO|nr:hypothetical protein LOOC260_117840 [Paucilactobacillus hokkaidonensis JCM 18461]